MGLLAFPSSASAYLNMKEGEKKISNVILTSSFIVFPSEEIRTSTCEKKESYRTEQREAYVRLCDPPLPGCQCLPASHGQKLVTFKLGHMDNVKKSVYKQWKNRRSPARAPSTSSNIF